MTFNDPTVMAFQTGFARAQGYAKRMGFADLIYEGRESKVQTLPDTKEWQSIEVVMSSGFRVKIGEVRPEGATADLIDQEIRNLINHFNGSGLLVPGVYEGPEAVRRKEICTRRLFRIIEEGGPQDDAILLIRHNADIDNRGAELLALARKLQRVDLEKILIGFGAKSVSERGL